jgi:outer membrane protein OmpA-like peptidoglycan-associated protein
MTDQLVTRPPASTGKPLASPAAASPAAVSKTPAVADPAAALGQAPAIAAREALPTIDLEVFFEFASAKLSPSAVATLVTLGRTLSDPRLADQTFIIAGYTDGKGKPDYNMWLSQLRADTVRQALITDFKIDPSRLIAKGYGKTKFKNNSNPLANENRRVQVINWTSKVEH